MNYFEILREVMITFSWGSLLRIFAVYVFGVAAGMFAKLALLDNKAKLSNAAYVMLMLSLILVFSAVVVGNQFFFYPAIEIKIISIIALIIFMWVGSKGINSIDDDDTVD